MRSATELCNAFLRALPVEAAARFADRDALAGRLRLATDAATATWPGLALAPARFVAHLAARLGPDASPDALATMRTSDVYLALACAGGDAAAIAAFEATYFDEIDRAGAKTGASADQVAEVKARLRRILFVTDGARLAATAAFAGRGDLRGWVRVTALRDLIFLLGQARRERPFTDDHLLDALSPADDPELGYIRELYRGAFEAAFREAVAALPARAKSLLRYQLVDGLTIDDIGAMYGVHRATAARWLTTARDQIAADTRARLATRVGMSSAEVDSIIRLVRSRLDVSVERLLGE
jgi:RNA polymerase sigma-70 factor (ECF subfamily)